MTPIEALNKLDETVLGNLEWKIALTSALEKQIPKKIIVEKYDIGGNDYFCPCCSEASKGLYCSNCGQALDWSDTE